MMDKILTDDAKQLQRLRNGDRSAFEQIYNRFQSKLYRAALTKVRSDDDAMEIVQEIFLDLWYRREQTRIEDLERYLIGAVKNKVLDYYKQEFKRERYVESTQRELSDQSSETEEEIAYNDLYESVFSCLNSLPDKTRSIFELNRIKGKSSEEISRMLDIPTRTVEYHITQGLKALRISLKDYLIIFLLIALS